MNLIKRVSLSGIAMGLVLSSLLLFGVVLAQNDTTSKTTTAPSDISPKLIPLAQELNCKTKTECAQKFDANFEQGITLAQKYDIYTKAQSNAAETFKTEVLEQLRNVSQDNFEQKILELANKILKDKPTLAGTLGVTLQTVTTAETIVKTKVVDAQKRVDLEQALLSGEYTGLGKVSVEQAGQICLKSGSESIADCDKIAARFFGPEGVNTLKEARAQTAQAKDYYANSLDKMQLTTPNGQTLIGKDAIKNACNQAFDTKNLELARACGDFAVKNGYTTPEEAKNGLKLLETFSQNAQGINFNDCSINPESCKQFLPDEFRSQFDSQSKIFKVMSDSIGFDPSRCANTSDSDIGKRCLEGARNALSQVEEIAKNSPEARKIVDEIKRHITEEGQRSQRLDAFNNQDSNRGGFSGPGGCKGPEECFKYCSQPTNSAECISFGTKNQIFDQNTAVQKFNAVNDILNSPDRKQFGQPPPGFNNQFGQQPQSGFNQYPSPSQQPAGPSPECFAAISSGDFVKAKTACFSSTTNYPKPIAEPYPLCPRIMASQCPEGQMRQVATDANNCPTYGACVAIENYKPIDTNPKPCPFGQYWDGKSCVTNPTTINPATGCAQAGGTWNASTNFCQMSTTNNCASGQWWDPVTKSCKSSPVQTVGSCNFATQYWKPSTSQCMPRINCSDTTNSEYNSMECQGVRSMTGPVGASCGSLTTQTTCQASPGCGWANGACGGNTNPYPTTGGTCPTGYHFHAESGGFCINSQENYSGTCYNAAGTSTITCPQNTYPGSSCPSGQYWYTPPGGGAGSCQSMSTACVQAGGTWNAGTNFCQMPTCPSGQYWYTPPSGGTGSCVSNTSSACPSGQYWNGTACVSNSTMMDPSAGCAQAGGTWNAGTHFCQMPTTSGTSCPSGQYWNGTACQSNTTPPSASSSCSSGQYWNGTSCVTAPNPPPGGGSDPAAMCAQAGGSWNGSTCVMPSSPPPPPPPSAVVLCSQMGGSWTGAACNLAENISNQKAYYDYFQKKSDSLLAQIIRAFSNLFR